MKAVGSFSQGKLYSYFVYTPVSLGDVNKPITRLTAGLSLREGCQGFSLATIYEHAHELQLLHRRQKENRTKRTS